MSRKKQFLSVLGLCVISAVLLSKGAQWLDQRRYPLVSSLTCIETTDSSDLYWNINQIAVSGQISTGDRKAVLTVSNNLPNFESYLFRLEGNEPWRKSADGRIDLEAGEGSHRMELKGINAFGGETPARLRTIKVTDTGITVIPMNQQLIAAVSVFVLRNRDRKKSHG